MNFPSQFPYALLLWITFILCNAASAQPPEIVGREPLCPDDAFATLTVDNTGNVYLAGATHSAIEGFTNLEDTDAFLVKRDPNGDLLWVRQFGTFGREYLTHIAVDRHSNVYSLGLFEPTAQPEGEGASEIIDVILLKYSSQGQEIWRSTLLSYNSQEDTFIDCFAIDRDGCAYVAGTTGSDLHGNTISGSSDTFLIKVTSEGETAWVKTYGSEDYEYCFSMAVDVNDDIVLCGLTRGEFEGCSSSGDADVFLVKINSIGDVLWTEQFGTSVYDAAASVVCQADGSICIAGHTLGDLSSESNAGEADVFVAKYNSNSSLQWISQFGTSSEEQALSIAADQDGALFVTGFTDGDFEANDSNEQSDAYCAALCSEGSLLWTKQFHSEEREIGYLVKPDATGGLYLIVVTEHQVRREENQQTLLRLALPKQELVPPEKSIRGQERG